MPTYREVKGRGISSLGEGKMIGTVDDLLIDPAALRVRWLRVGSGKLLGGGHWLPAEAVREIDGQAVTIDSEADERDSEGTAASTELLSSVRDIIGRPIVDASGNDLGKVRDFGFALEGFAIENLQVIQELNDTVVSASSLDIRARSMHLENGVIILTDRRPS